MAITKVAIAATALLSDGRVTEIRLAAASLADRPLRLIATESTLLNKTLSPETRASARSALISEVRPIDDIRSTALYRRHVAANLLDEFLDMLEQKHATSMIA